MKIILPLILTILLSQSVFAQTYTNQPKTDSLRRNLEEVTVSSKYDQRYNVGNASGTLKLDQALLRVPQNIQIIDQSIIRDQ